jgi:hypothetical protein
MWQYGGTCNWHVHHHDSQSIWLTENQTWKQMNIDLVCWVKVWFEESDLFTYHNRKQMMKLLRIKIGMLQHSRTMSQKHATSHSQSRGLIQHLSQWQWAPLPPFPHTLNFSCRLKIHLLSNWCLASCEPGRHPIALGQKRETFRVKASHLPRGLSRKNKFTRNCICFSVLQPLKNVQDSYYIHVNIQCSHVSTWHRTRSPHPFPWKMSAVRYKSHSSKVDLNFPMQAGFGEKWSESARRKTAGHREIRI